ncbi:MAG: family transcriptional regulator [Clostridia bacterium]|jgi:predicted NBD/HSP70 family sugar kinase|nr:family transcriptional regulator [Clostridia bacterium]
MIKKGASNIEVKKINRNQIFRYINKYRRVSKPDIAAALQISMPTVLQNVNELIEQDLVEQVGEFQSRGGRKAIAIAPIQDCKYAIGIDITSRHIGFVLTDLSGEVLQHTRVNQIYANEMKYYKALADIANSYKEKWSIPDEKFLGYGISIPGIIDSKNKKITVSHALNISNISCDKFTQFMSYDCIYINDANAAAISEIYNADRSSNAIYLSLSNSVGGAIIEQVQSYLYEKFIDDNLYLGDNWRSGEFGHVTLVPNGNECYCGKLGCFDAYCSATTLSKYTNGKLEVFFEELQKGNAELEAIWEEYLNYLSIQVNSLRMIFDCQIIIGGYVGSFIEPYIGYLRDEASKRNTFGEDADYIIPCRYKVEASALGAALQQIEEFLSTI